jgi:hypothetical protein
MPDTLSAPATETIQQASISCLESWPFGAGVTVEAFELDWPAFTTCANDRAHGIGNCYAPTDQFLCLACTITWLVVNARPGVPISIDVTR